jgi:hypothetical protein
MDKLNKIRPIIDNGEKQDSNSIWNKTLSKLGNALKILDKKKFAVKLKQKLN